jgi:hypothetical protein
MFYKLSQYKKVDSGGRHLNNIGGRVEDKFEFINKYKFSICFENFKGARSEKLFEAFGANTIPIYWGDSEIADEYNSKAFVNFYDYGCIEKVIERVIEIDNDDELYLQIMREPAFLRQKTYEEYFDDLTEFFVNIFETPIEEAKRDPKLLCYELIEYYGRKKYYLMGKWQKRRVKILHLFNPLKNIPPFKQLNVFRLKHRRQIMNSGLDD